MTNRTIADREDRRETRQRAEDKEDKHHQGSKRRRVSNSPAHWRSFDSLSKLEIHSFPIVEIGL